MDDSRRHILDRCMKEMEHNEFQRKAWMQIDMSSSAWITACPKEHIALTARQFSIVAQTYFGVAQRCLEGLVGQPILQKSGRRGRQNLKDKDKENFGTTDDRRGPLEIRACSGRWTSSLWCSVPSEKEV